MRTPFRKAYRNGFRRAYVGQKSISSQFSFATADGSEALSIKLRFPVGKTITVDWGDDSKTNYNGAGTSTDVSLSKTYSGAGTYPITFSGDYLELTYLNCYNNSLTGDVSGWSALTSLTYLNCYNSSLTGDVSGWSALTSLSILSCGNNSLTGDVSGWSALTSLTTLYCNNNSLTGDVSGWSALTSLTTLNCYDNSLTFNSSSAWTSHNHNFDISDNNLSSTMVDNWLNACAGGSFASKVLTGHGTNGARTSASDAAVATLTGNGNTITTS
jgi:hypothetical protein